MWCKSICDVKPGLDPCPLLARSWNRLWLDFVSFIAYKEVKIKFKKAKCVSNRCNDLFKRKKSFGFRCTLSNSLPLQCPGGLVLEKLGGGVWPASQNPYPTYDQNLRYSIPHLWPDQKFETLFMTWLLCKNPFSDQHYNTFPSSDQCWITVNIICEGLLLIFFSIMMKKWLLLKNVPRSRLECKNHTLFMTKIVKSAQIPYLWPKQLKNHTL